MGVDGVLKLAHDCPMILSSLVEPRPANAVAIMAPERQAMTYGGFASLCEITRDRLNGLGLGRNEKLAIVLPNGPEMAVAFVA